MISFAAELNLRLKTSGIRCQNKPTFNIWCGLIPDTHNMKFQLIPMWFAYGSVSAAELNLELEPYQNKPQFYV